MLYEIQNDNSRYILSRQIVFLIYFGLPHSKHICWKWRSGCGFPVCSPSGFNIPSFPLMKVCFDLSISPQTTIKKAIYHINTGYCKSHLQAACTFPRRSCHANSCSMFIVQKYQFQQSLVSYFWGPIQFCCPSPLPKCARMARTPPKSGNDKVKEQLQNQLAKFLHIENFEKQAKIIISSL